MTLVAALIDDLVLLPASVLLYRRSYGACGSYQAKHPHILAQG